MRDTTFDVMKGIGIIAMIIGHCPIPWIIKDFIFAWHMPMFFLISGYFFRPSPIKQYIKKNFRSLVIPYLLTATLLFLINTLKVFFHKESDLTNSFIGIFVASGSYGLPTFSQYFVGAIWFLFAMFWCRIIYNIFINKYTSPTASIIIINISILATYMGTEIFIPTNILQGLSAMIFFQIGKTFRERNVFSIAPQSVLIIIGVLTIAFSLMTSNNDYPLSMVRCYYGFYPINVIAACFCSFLLYHIIKLCRKDLFIYRFLAYIGRISMVILCVHIIELSHNGIGYLNNTYMHWEGSIYSITSVIWHTTLALSLSMLLLKSKNVRNIFQIHY